MTARRRKHSKARRNSNSKVSGTTGGNASNSNEGRGSTSIETSGASSSVANHADLNSIENGEQLADEVETIWQTFHRHPITRLSLIVLLPYGIYIAYLYIQLQKPHWVNRILPPQLHLRPAVAVTDERQVLIMGSMSSGTTQVVKSIKKIFGGKIEIGHEDSNTAWSYVRDGTVSWFYFIRYLPTSNSRGFWKKKEDPAKSIEIRTKACFDICGDGTLPSNDEHFKIIEKMGFHPFMYQEPEMKCSFRKRMGDKCWVRECIRNIFNEYGCAIRNDCTIKFRRVLHQVRNPLRTIESLMVKFCHVDNEGHQDKSDDRINENDYDTRKERILQVNKPHPSLMIYIKALFPHSTISEQTHKWDDYTCLQSIGHYVVLYNQILLDANKQQNRNLISDWYRIEDTSPCELMRLSGFMNDNDAVVVYPPNYDIVQSVCQDENNTDATTLPRRTSSSKKLKKMANEPFEQTDNLINLENIRLGWSDVRNNCNSVGGGRELEKKIKLLFRDLGYNTSQEND